MRDAVMSWVAFNPTRICIWSSGVNTSVFAPRRTDRQLAEELGLQGKFIVMYHGVLTFHPNRGLAEAVQAMKLVKGRNSQVVLVLLGNGPAADYLQELATELSIKSSVLLLSSVPYQEVPRYIGLCDVGLMAYPDTDYWKMNNPIKLLEYLAIGKPVIVRDMLTFRSVVGRSRGAILISSNDPVTIADAICKAQENKHFLRTEGLKGRELIVRNFTWAQQAAKLDSFLRGEGLETGKVNSSLTAVEQAGEPNEHAFAVPLESHTVEPDVATQQHRVRSRL